MKLSRRYNWRARQWRAPPPLRRALNQPDAFLDGDLPYLQIVDSLAQVLGEHTGIDNPDLAQIMEAQTWAKGKAQQIVMNAR